MSSRDKLIPLAMTSLKRAGVVVEVDFFGEVSVFYEVDPAWRPLKHVQGAYQWLCNHYEAGAKISIVGFSRGAYTARVLSALICCLGMSVLSLHAFIHRSLRTQRRLTSVDSCQPGRRHE